MRLKAWFLETRPQFLTLSIVLAFLGTTTAWYWHVKFLGIGSALLAGLCWLLLAHTSVWCSGNDYFDFKSGIDLATKRTPFSGGSGILPAGLLTPKQVLWLGIGALIVAMPIGIYFAVIVRNSLNEYTGWELLPLLVLAAFFIVLSSELVFKAPLAGMGSRAWNWAHIADTGTVLCDGSLHLAGSGGRCPVFLPWCTICSCLTSSLTPRPTRKPNGRPCRFTVGKKNAAIFFTVVAIRCTSGFLRGR